MATVLAARKGERSLGRRVLRAAALAAIALALVPVLAVVLFRHVDPPYSMHMARQALAGVAVRQTWVPIERVSTNVLEAVVSSEDARFCEHRGVDWQAVEDALAEAEREGGPPRGASTITMQTVKNLFLWSDRSYVRKAIEIPLAYVADAVWPKRRTLEIYLNVAEWGPGIFGVEQAARHHFRKSAASLGRSEAALLAAALPNPHLRRAGRPGPQTRRSAVRIEARMPAAAPLIGCVLAGD